MNDVTGRELQRRTVPDATREKSREKRRESLRAIRAMENDRLGRDLWTRVGWFRDGFSMWEVRVLRVTRESKSVRGKKEREAKVWCKMRTTAEWASPRMTRRWHKSFGRGTHRVKGWGNLVTGVADTGQGKKRSWSPGRKSSLSTGAWGERNATPSREPPGDTRITLRWRQEVQ